MIWESSRLSADIYFKCWTLLRLRHRRQVERLCLGLLSFLLQHLAAKGSVSHHFRHVFPMAWHDSLSLASCGLPQLPRSFEWLICPWTFLSLWKIFVRFRSGLSHLPALRRCLPPLLFGLACFQKPYIFHTSFWEFGWFLLEVCLLCCCRESRTASGLVVMVSKSQQSVIFSSAVRYWSWVPPGSRSRRLNLYISNCTFLRGWQY